MRIDLSRFDSSGSSTALTTLEIMGRLTDMCQRLLKPEKPGPETQGVGEVVVERRAFPEVCVAPDWDGLLPENFCYSVSPSQMPPFLGSLVQQPVPQSHSSHSKPYLNPPFQTTPFRTLPD